MLSESKSKVSYIRPSSAGSKSSLCFSLIPHQTFLKNPKSLIYMSLSRYILKRLVIESKLLPGVATAVTTIAVAAATSSSFGKDVATVEARIAVTVASLYKRRFSWQLNDLQETVNFSNVFAKINKRDERSLKYLKDSNRREEGALKYLKNIKWNRVEEPKIFTLELLFVQNSYFRTLSSPRHMYHIKPSLSSKRPLGMNMIFSSYHRSWSLTDEGKPKVRRERVKRFITSVEFITF
ncbi:LOW QUALITY PROTEIN: hypothetical protein HID58_071749 [Brassica napus]|uniref:Uncharacterized protein n=1 Tax=Brassica napus TaxID=3708 RepID=A0ABQ7Z2Q0_BRANA|nr:LOW QUALITY PROTEIN: hypothetical protein HID58_071749 [Brassica napus]